MSIIRSAPKLILPTPGDAELPPSRSQATAGGGHKKGRALRRGLD
jgi:hypothetical protein